MKGYQLAGVVLMVLGVLALAYGGFTYTKETHEASLGSLSLSVADKERFNTPVWAGVRYKHRHWGRGSAPFPAP